MTTDTQRAALAELVARMMHIACESGVAEGRHRDEWLNLVQRTRAALTDSTTVSQQWPALIGFLQEICGLLPADREVECLRLLQQYGVGLVATPESTDSATSSGGVSQEAAREHYDEVKATLQGAHAIMETVSGLERRVGPVGSHARGYTHKITAALRHLDALAHTAPVAPKAEPAPQDKVKRNDPISALAIRLLVAAGHVTQEKADEAFTIACNVTEVEARKLDAESPQVLAAQAAPAEAQAEPTFDIEGFVAALHRSAEARGKTMKEVSAETGVSESTLSRMKTSGRKPDAASLAALSAWAGLNPAHFSNAAPWRPVVDDGIANTLLRAAAAQAEPVALLKKCSRYSLSTFGDCLIPDENGGWLHFEEVESALAIKAQEQGT